MLAGRVLAVVSHDAGGAEVVSSFVRRAGNRCHYVLGGPAIEIFRRKLGAVPNEPLNDAIAASEAVITGTSWSSDLCWNAIAAARRMGKPVATFLDHWVNYRERFIRHGVERLPDELIVGDDDARRIAEHNFPSLPVRQIDNPYFADLRADLASAAAPRAAGGGARILYVAEPVREHALAQHGDPRAWGYTEEDALRFFVGCAQAIAPVIDSIALRPHPSEAIDKYDWIQSETQLPISIGRDQTLLQQIANSDVVVGCESMAMVVGLVAGKRVISSIPPGGRPCVLPQASIERLSVICAGALNA